MRNFIRNFLHITEVISFIGLMFIGILGFIVEILGYVRIGKIFEIIGITWSFHLFYFVFLLSLTVLLLSYFGRKYI